MIFSSCRWNAGRWWADGEGDKEERIFRYDRLVDEFVSLNSFSSLQAERYQKVLESYDLFMRLYAASPYRQEVEKLVEEAKEHIYSIE